MSTGDAQLPIILPDPQGDPQPTIAEIVLRVLLAGAVVTAVFALPGLALLLKPFVDAQRNHERNERIQHSLRRLKYRGMIRFNRQQRCWVLTDKGRRQAQLYELHRLQFPARPATWDGRWRLIIFDVPERATYLREVFRRKIQALGVTYLQRSVWVYPFPCQDVLQELIRRLELEGCVVIAEADSLKPEERLLRKYQLTRTP